MIDISEFITGVKEKYPAQLLKGRIEIEGNVISCFFKDMLLLDDTTFEQKDFVTADGLFYFSLLKNLRKNFTLLMKLPFCLIRIKKLLKNLRIKVVGKRFNIRLILSILRILIHI